MGIWNKLTLGVHIKELNNFKKFSALLAPQNRVPVSVNLSTAYEMTYSEIETQTILTNIPRISLSVSLDPNSYFSERASGVLRHFTVEIHFHLL